MHAAHFWRRIFPHSLVTLTSIAMTNVNGIHVGESSDGSSNSKPKPRRHPKYWFDDGSLVVHTRNDLFKVHRTLLCRHSAVLSSLSQGIPQNQGQSAAPTTIDGCPIAYIPDGMNVDSADLEALLEHLYHDT